MKCDKCDVIVSRLRETQSAESRVAELLSALNKAAQPAATSPSLSDVPFTQLPPLSIECRVCRDEGIERTSRAFVLAPPVSVVLCGNRLHSAAEVSEVLWPLLGYLRDPH